MRILLENMYSNNFNNLLVSRPPGDTSRRKTIHGLNETVVFVAEAI